MLFMMGRNSYMREKCSKTAVFKLSLASRVFPCFYKQYGICCQTQNKTRGGNLSLAFIFVAVLNLGLKISFEQWVLLPNEFGNYCVEGAAESATRKVCGNRPWQCALPEGFPGAPAPASTSLSKLLALRIGDSKRKTKTKNHQ